jgi:hypothetical protein
MKKNLGRVGAFLLASASFWAEAGDLLHAQYSRRDDRIHATFRNTCRSIELIPQRMCLRSYPGKTGIMIRYRPLQTFMRCRPSGFIHKSLSADDLGCRPANVTLRDEDGFRINVFVPRAHP